MRISRGNRVSSERKKKNALVNFKRCRDQGKPITRIETFMHLAESMSEESNRSYCFLSDGKNSQKVQVALTEEACGSRKRSQISGKDSN